MSWYSTHNFTTKLLNNNPEVQQLITSEMFMIQFKNNNERITTYIKQHLSQILVNLFEYCLILPQQTSSQKRKYKYPYLSMEFLEILLKRYDFTDQNFYFALEIFFRSLFQNKICELQSTLIPGYSYRIFTQFKSMDVKIQQKKWRGEILIFEYIEKNQNTLYKLLNYTQYQSIMLITKDIIMNDKIKQYKFQPLYCKLNAINLLYTKLDQSLGHSQQQVNQRKIQNIFNFFLELFKRQRDYYEGEEIIKILADQKNINQYYLKTLRQCSQNAICTSIKQALIDIVKFCAIENKNIKYFEQVLKFIKNFTVKPSIINCTVITAIQYMLTNYEGTEIAKLLIRENVIKNILSNIVSYPSYNIMHNKIRDLIGTIFSNRNIQIIEHLFTQCNVIQFILDSTYRKQSTSKIYSKDKQPIHCQQYFNQLLSIPKLYTQNQIKTKLIQQSIAKHNLQWQMFSQKILETYVEIITQRLGEYIKVEEIENFQVEQIIYNVKNYLTCQRQLEKNNVDDEIIIGNFVKIQEQSHVQISSLCSIASILDKTSLNKQMEQDILQPIVPSNHNKQYNNFEDYLKSAKSSITSAKQNSLPRSKSLSKIKSTDSKKNRWKDDNIYTSRSSQKSQNKQNQKNISIFQHNIKKIGRAQQIKLFKINKDIPITQKCRQLNQKRDNRLIKWLKIIKV